MERSEEGNHSSSSVMVHFYSKDEIFHLLYQSHSSIMNFMLDCPGT